jgi:hypothetical protein
MMRLVKKAAQEKAEEEAAVTQCLQKALSILADGVIFECTSAT